MSTFDQLSLSSCKVICLCDKYYAKVSTAKPVALFLSLPMMALTLIMCSSISNPNFLLQKPFAHGTESCIESSAFQKSFAVFIFLIQKKWLVPQLSVYCITNIMTVYKRVNSRSHDTIFKNSAGWVAYFVTYVLKCYESTRSFNVFYTQCFPSNPIREQEYISLMLNVAVVP